MGPLRLLPRAERSGSSVSYPISLVLVLLAVVPLMGSGIYAVGAARSAQQQRDHAEAIDSAVAEFVVLSELRTRLLDERNWRSAQIGLVAIGLNTGQVRIFSGVDVEAELDLARREVDLLFDRLASDDLDAVEAELNEVRANPDIDIASVGPSYDQIEAAAAESSETILDELMVTAGSIAGADDLLVSLRILEATTIARQSISAEFTHYFSAQFTESVDQEKSFNALGVERSLRAAQLAQIRRIMRPDSTVAEALATIDASPDVARFEAAGQKLLDDGLTEFTLDPEELLGLVADLTEITTAFRASSISTDLYFEMIRAASADVTTASDTLGSNAATRNVRALGSLTALIVFCGALFVFARRALLGPIALLADTARHIRDGVPDTEHQAAAGPREIRAATEALNEAGDQLKLAERQAIALAAGDLDHPSLGSPTSGRLGASLQDAVRTLATSLQEREEFRRRMTHEATHDGLTQLPNRKAALARLEQGLARTERSSASIAALFLDLDGFKDINDHHGHPAGDAVLKIVAERLGAEVRRGDHVGRLGGDEFVVIAEPVADEEEALQLAERLQQAVAQPMAVDDLVVSVNVSVGVAVGSGGAIDADLMLRDADLAMYKAKREGKGQAALCTDELRTELEEKADLEQAIRSAIKRDEFVLYYQPIVDRLTGHHNGLEALIRWERPGMGIVGPDTFIPFAERSDLIIAIDNWVLNDVAEQIVRWEADGVNGDLTVSVNVSGRHLDSPDFVSDVLGPLHRYGIDPRRLVIEVTESALLEDLTGAGEKLNTLRAAGIRTAIDDFGTGYTSLAHLKRLPIDILKIDRSFVSDDDAGSLVQLIIDTGHLLGATVVAEGVETAAQAQSLTSMGTDKLQGFLYGKPEPVSRSNDATTTEPATSATEQGARPI